MLAIFDDYQPPVRNDGLPWLQAIIQESSQASGPWAVIDTITLSPVETDPLHPQAYSFTTDEAELSDGWYRIIWKDAAGDERPTTPVRLSGDIRAQIRPTLQSLSSIMRNRLKTTYGIADVFNNLDGDAGTTPSANQASDNIDVATDMVLTKLGLTFDSKYYRLASRASMFKAAALIELGYWPEESNDKNSAYANYESQYNQLMATLITALQGDVPGGSGTKLVSVPMVGSRGYADSYGYNLDDVLI